MADPRTDQIAREAARLIQEKRTDEIADAIHLAAESLGLNSAPLPGHVRVRQHARAMSMQSLGDAGYREAVREVWRLAEEMMTALDQVFADAPTLLVGRAAQGYIDAGVTIHIRMYTRESVHEIARALVEFEYDEPEFATIETQHGRLSQLRFRDDDHTILVTRCMPELLAQRHMDLLTGKPIHTLDLSELRKTLSELNPIRL